MRHWVNKSLRIGFLENLTREVSLQDAILFPIHDQSRRWMARLSAIAEVFGVFSNLSERTFVFLRFFCNYAGSKWVGAALKERHHGVDG